MKRKTLVRILVITVILSLNIGCDQISKTIVRKKIDNYGHIGLLNDHLVLTKVENSGAFLSLGDSLPKLIKTILLIILPILMLAFGTFYLLTEKKLSKLKILGIASIIGGGIGNIFDRAVYGSVTDFIHIDFVLFRTGVLNLADLSITFGAALLLFEAFFSKKSTRGPVPDDNNNNSHII